MDFSWLDTSDNRDPNGGVHWYQFDSHETFVPPRPLIIRDRTNIPYPQTVVPYQLCAECRAFCASLRGFAAPHRFPHYSSGLNIARAARSGCHLCSIILVRLKYSPKNDDAGSRQEPKWKEDDPRALDSIVNLPKRKHRSLRSSGKLVLDFRFRGADWGSDMLNVGSVYLECGPGIDTPVPSFHVSRWHTSLGSDACIELAQSWVRHCHEAHPHCQLSQPARPPHRLVRLDAFEKSKDVRVGEYVIGPAPPYATLSWRWGPHLRSRLITSTVEAYQHRLGFKHLAKTFQDAVTVVRKLGYSHLWIDALCIVQDDADSLHEEIARMDEVYSACDLTLAVASAPDNDKGFLQDRWPLSWHDCWLSRGGDVNIVAHADEAKIQDSAPGHCPLDARGWVIQERFLSPRTLYFGKEHIFWECRQMKRHEQEEYSADNQASPYAEQMNDKEQDVIQHDLLLDSAVVGLLKRCYPKLQHLTADTAARDLTWEFTLRNSWHLIVSSYSRSALTNEQDKMRALAGAAAPIQKRFGLKASFGLWHEFFLTELLWSALRSDGPHPDPKTTDLAPSWSWMARNRTVINKLVMDLHSRIQFPKMSRMEPRAELLRMPPETAFNVPLQSIQDLTTYAVRLKGPLLQVEWGIDATEGPDEWRHDNGYFVTTPRKRSLERDSDHRHEHRNFSADYMLPSDLDLWCLLVSCRFHDARGLRNEQHGLVLKAVHGVPGRYRRVGAFEHKYTQSCQACPLFPENVPIVEVEVV